MSGFLGKIPNQFPLHPYVNDSIRNKHLNTEILKKSNNLLQPQV